MQQARIHHAIPPGSGAQLTLSRALDSANVSAESEPWVAPLPKGAGPGPHGHARRTRGPRRLARMVLGSSMGAVGNSSSRVASVSSLAHRRKGSSVLDSPGDGVDPLHSTCTSSPRRQRSATGFDPPHERALTGRSSQAVGLNLRCGSAPWQHRP